VAASRSGSSRALVYKHSVLFLLFIERFSLLVVHDVHIQLDFCFLVLVLASTCTSHFISMSSGLESIKQSYGVIHNAISVPNRYCKCPCNSLFIFFLLELLAFNSYKAFICCI
jgi:hypothetical protein